MSLYVRNLAGTTAHGVFCLIPMLALLTGCQLWHRHNHFSDAQIAALERTGFTRIVDSNSMEFDGTDRLLFARGEATLGPEARHALERIGYVLINMHVEHICVNGYTDADGGVNYNQQLSIRRAKAVVRVLMDIGIPAKDIEMHGYGESSPVADNATKAGRSQNRRVAVVVSSE
ncbi:OmpA family protein [Paraburkholderia sp. MMS20-SJTR3]|uniref:OmpA family protein n=1 Tax=Paraburkholderia sejongensis TaxID=2886946 RepID=A0ABS8K3T0_9BURK|nr:OmpA family protein [Paraburkholderia sp. MMS20-SJTR3]MCC8396805.1 OmpA family protein [Paraburkholderia sp. MMS20-SJTR3]